MLEIIPFEYQLMITLLKMVVLYLIYPIREQEYGCSLKMRMDTYKEVFLTKVA